MHIAIIAEVSYSKGIDYYIDSTGAQIAVQIGGGIDEILYFSIDFVLLSMFAQDWGDVPCPHDLRQFTSFWINHSMLISMGAPFGLNH